MNPEVLIIGGGVIGLSIARELHKQGVSRITLLEQGVCGEEASWAAAGMLGPQVEANEAGTFFDLCFASRDMYAELAAELLDETGIDIELDRSGTLYLAFTDEDVREIRERFEWQHKAGLSIDLLSAEDVRRFEPLVSPDVRESLYFPNDWQVENRKLVAALKHYAEINGIAIRENVKVEKLTVKGQRVVGAETKEGCVFADKAVLATGAWTSLIKLGPIEMPLKIEPVLGQMIAFDATRRLVRNVIYSSHGYVVPRRDGRILAGSTSEMAGFEKSVTESASASLKKMAGMIVPEIAGLEINDRWAGLRPFASDGLPVLGTVGGIEDLFIATGHYRNGILLAPLTAKIAAENLVNGTASEYFRAFGPDRFGRRSVGSSG